MEFCDVPLFSLFVLLQRRPPYCRLRRRRHPPHHLDQRSSHPHLCSALPRPSSYYWRAADGGELHSVLAPPSDCAFVASARDWRYVTPPLLPPSLLPSSLLGALYIHFSSTLIPPPSSLPPSLSPQAAWTSKRATVSSSVLLPRWSLKQEWRTSTTTTCQSWVCRYVPSPPSLPPSLPPSFLCLAATLVAKTGVENQYYHHLSVMGLQVRALPSLPPSLPPSLRLNLLPSLPPSLPSSLPSDPRPHRHGRLPKKSSLVTCCSPGRSRGREGGREVWRERKERRTLEILI